MDSIKNIIFDFDGTIADTFEDFCNIINDFVSKQGYNTTKEEVYFILQNKSFSEIIAKLKLSKFQILKYTYLGRKHFSNIKSNSSPINGMPDFLLELKKAGYKLGIVSSNSEKYINNFLKKYNLDFFDFVVKSSLFNKHKILKKVCTKYKMEISNTIYVGDEIRDSIACKKIGMNVILVTWGYSSKNLLLQEASNNAIVESIHEFASLLL